MEDNNDLILDTSGQAPKNWQTESIIALVLAVITCSCLGIPTAIIGLVFATKVDKAHYRGDSREALSASNTAKILLIVTACLVVFSLVLGVGMNILGYIMEGR